MSRMRMGFQIFLGFVFILSIGVKANPLEHCMSTIKFDEEFEFIIKQAGEAQLNLFCTNMTSFLNCVNGVMKEQTGFTIRQFALYMEGTDIGRALTTFVNLEDLVAEICTEGTKMHEDYLANADCYRDVDPDLPKECEKQAKEAYESFRDLQDHTNSAENPLDQPCLTIAYQLGCLGAAVHEGCGDDGFEVYKETVRRIGFTSSGVCSSEIVQNIKARFIDSLELSEPRRSLYRIVADLKKRRK